MQGGQNINKTDKQKHKEKMNNIKTMRNTQMETINKINKYADNKEDQHGICQPHNLKTDIKNKDSLMKLSL